MPHILAYFVQQGIIQEVERGRYKAITLNKYVDGVIDRNNNGKTHLIPDDGGEKIFIADRNLGHAMKNDRVRVLVYAKRSSRQTEGEVVEILERNKTRFVGVMSICNGVSFVIVDNRLLSNDIYVPKESGSEWENTIYEDGENYGYRVEESEKAYHLYKE